MSDDQKPRLIIQPGAFDFFDGTQEELDQLMAALNKAFGDGSLLEKSTPIDMDTLAEQDPEFHEFLQSRLAEIDTDRSKKLN